MVEHVTARRRDNSFYRKLRQCVAGHEDNADRCRRAMRAITGTYVHGLFGLAAQRTAWLAALGVAGSGVDHSASIDAALDAIAAELEVHLDIDGLLAIARADGDH